MDHVELQQGGGDVVGTHPRRPADGPDAEAPPGTPVQVLQHHASPIGPVRPPAQPGERLLRGARLALPPREQVAWTHINHTRKHTQTIHARLYTQNTLHINTQTAHTRLYTQNTLHITTHTRLLHTKYSTHKHTNYTHNALYTHKKPHTTPA